MYNDYDDEDEFGELAYFREMQSNFDKLKNNEVLDERTAQNTLTYFSDRIDELTEFKKTEIFKTWLADKQKVDEELRLFHEQRETDLKAKQAELDAYKKRGKNSKARIKPDLEQLKNMNVAELTQYGQKYFNSASGFSSFKKALLEFGIDYNAMRFGAKNERMANFLADAETLPELVLYSDAKIKYDRFGITDKDGKPVWYGKFFERWVNEQSVAEMESAKKAVWFASQVAKKNGLAKIKLKLFVDAEWLTYANEVFNDNVQNKKDLKTGGKARKLGEEAMKNNVVLNVQWVSGEDNPADEYTICDGYKKWQDNDFEALVKK